MEKISLLTLVGGISQGSLNKKLYNSIKKLNLTPFEFVDFDISTLPYFSQDLELDPPDIVSEFKDLIRNTNGLLIITPEYNRSYPGVLKNAIDWGSRPYGENLWSRKPCGILGASVGNIGTFGAQNHLRQVFVYLDMMVLNHPEFYFNASQSFDEKGELTNAKSKELLQEYFKLLHEHIHLVTKTEHDAPFGQFQKNGPEDFPYAI